MSSQGSLYQSIFSYLRSLNFHFLESWVIECVNYYKSENPEISLEKLKNEVKQQWLLVNLREIKVPSLPPDLKSKKNIILNGTYVVQVESMIDSSKSCYSQFQKLLKIDIENIEATEKTEEWNIKSNRCLTFVLSDGVQEIQAMEYQPIKKIRTNDPELLPGFKMLIAGPVECRIGMILLKDENITVLGGEVDTLTESNSLKSILIKKLELDESDYIDRVSSDLEKENKILEQPSHEIMTVDNLDECVESLLSQNDDVFLTIPLESEILASEVQVKENSTIQSDIVENHLFNQNINYWSESELNQNHYSVNSKKHSLSQDDIQTSSQKRLSFDPEWKNNEAVSSGWNSTTQNLLDIDGDGGDDNIFIDNSDKLQSLNSKNASQIKKPVQTKLSSFFKNNDSSFNNVYTTLSSNQNCVYVSDKPFVYLKHIMSVKLSKSIIFTVKAIILTLKKKIAIENDEFNLKANITDGSANLDVDFSSEILEEILGFSPCEMLVMLKAKQTNSAIAQKIKESFSKAQEKLISLNCLMKIKFFIEDKSPVILSLEEVTTQHLKALKERS